MLQELDVQLERARREAAALAREGNVLAGRLSAAEGAGAAQADELRRLRADREDLLARWERAAEQAAAGPPSPSYHYYGEGPQGVDVASPRAGYGGGQQQRPPAMQEVNK